MDEFDTIARLFRPLAEDAPEALGLMDDAAVLPVRSGFELVITTDTLVEGVHFRADDAPEHIAQKLLRVNLSDLAAKAAEPYGYLLNLAWPPSWGEARRTAFANGLAHDQAAFGLKLFGGDTVSTPGPLTIGATLFGHVPAGRMVKRSGAKVGDVVLVSGTIGDGALGLKALNGDLTGLDDADLAALAARYLRPEPRLELRQALRAYAMSAADVSDGLLADVGHIAEASGLGVEIELERIPFSSGALAVLNSAHDSLRGHERPMGWLLTLATSGDDYEVVCTADADLAPALIAAAEAVGVQMTAIGRMTAGRGVLATFEGKAVQLDRLGWRHG